MGKQKIQKATDWLLDQESYPNNLLVAAKGRSDCALPAALIRDVLDGIHYALSSLPETEQTILRQHYAQGLSLLEIGQALALSPEQVRQYLSKALQKLRGSFRWNFICYGINGWLKKSADKAYHRGYRAGYRQGLEDGHSKPIPNGPSEELLRQPVQGLDLPNYVKNSLHKRGYDRVGDLISLTNYEIWALRGIGNKGIAMVACLLQSMGIYETEWEKLALL